MTTKKTKASLDFLEGLAGKLTLGSLLLAIRQGEEMTQIEFAKLLGVSKQYLCDLEHGRRFVSPKAAAEYAKKLGYSSQQFVKLCLQDLVDRDGLDSFGKIVGLYNLAGISHSIYKPIHDNFWMANEFIMVMWNKVKSLIEHYPLTAITNALSINTNQIRENIKIDAAINFVEATC
jgi:transcriptional regulator with XRE-family HTH domain